MPSLEEAIRRRAYELWEAEGCPEGRDQDFWYIAEREMTTVEASATTEPQPPGVLHSAGAAAEPPAPAVNKRTAKAAAPKAAKPKTNGTGKAAATSGAKAKPATGKPAPRGRKPARTPPATTGET